jgi:hypothetical protein
MKPILLSILSCIFILVACKLSTNNSNDHNQNDSLNTSQDNGNMQSVYYRFPTPNEIFGFIRKESLKYDPNLTNQLDNANKHLDSKSQTVVLGVYIADLSYITLFEAYNNSIEYYKTIHSLSEKVRISSAYDLAVAKRIEKNLLNIDSLKNISIDSYSSMVEFLIMNNREKTLALVAAGAYIECFYLAFNLAGDYTENNPLITKIMDLKYAFENLYSYLQIYSDDEQVGEMAKQLKGLDNQFSSLKETQKSKTKVKQDKNGNLVFEGGSKIHMSKEQFELLRDEIFKLRKTVI